MHIPTLENVPFRTKGELGRRNAERSFWRITLCFPKEKNCILLLSWRNWKASQSAEQAISASFRNFETRVFENASTHNGNRIPVKNAVSLRPVWKVQEVLRKSADVFQQKSARFSAKAPAFYPSASLLERGHAVAFARKRLWNAKISTGYCYEKRPFHFLLKGLSGYWRPKIIDQKPMSLILFKEIS